MSQAASPTDLRPPPAWTQALFGRRLTPLARGPDPAATVWGIEGDQIAGRISEQFKSGAGEYHARYAASAHFEDLFRKTIAALSVSVPDAPLIFDMGSGSGVNSIVPCFSLFPGARQVASDLSGDLLVMLADHAAQAGLSDRVSCVVMDAMDASVLPERFDLVTGASILHHLVRPVRGLTAAARALKPGGQAIFVEPFDGYGLVRLAYERILAEADLRREPLAPPVDQMLRAMVADIVARTAPDPTRPGFADLDDKWLFSREGIEQIARQAGFASARFVTHAEGPALYRKTVGIQLRLATGRDDLELPAWAMDILDSFDAALPPPVKRLLMLEGSIVLTKAG